MNPAETWAALKLLEHALKAAVLERHRPSPGVQSRNGNPVCDECGEPDGWASEWPCATVQAIETALGES